MATEMWQRVETGDWEQYLVSREINNEAPQGKHLVPRKSPGPVPRNK